MDVFLFISGAALIIMAMLDFIWTTLWVQGGAGPITSKLSDGIWFLARKGSRDNRYVLSLVGPVLLVSTVMSWVILFLAGWICIFSSNESILTNSQHDGSASLIDRIYYVGYTFFTLGSGNWTPSGDVWKLLSIALTASGMLSITFAVTYLINVVSAVNTKRSFAQNVLGIGNSGIDMLHTAWNGKDFNSLDKPLSLISSDLSKLIEQYNAYPVLHYYYNKDSDKSASLAVAALDDMLLMMEQHLSEDILPNKVIMKQTRSSINSFLDTLDFVALPKTIDEPPYPDLAKLHEEGVPVQKKTLEQHVSNRRKKLHTLVRFNARNWPS